MGARTHRGCLCPIVCFGEVVIGKDLMAGPSVGLVPRGHRALVPWELFPGRSPPILILGVHGRRAQVLRRSVARGFAHLKHHINSLLILKKKKIQHPSGS
mgnify:CR=1 FL=1